MYSCCMGWPLTSSRQVAIVILTPPLSTKSSANLKSYWLLSGFVYSIKTDQGLAWMSTKKKVLMSGDNK